MLPRVDIPAPNRQAGVRFAYETIVHTVQNKEESRVGRRTNYGFEKRQRELKKQKKREAKAERKRLRKEGLEGAVSTRSGQ